MDDKEEKDGKSVSGVVSVEGLGTGLPGRLPPRGVAAPDLDRYRRHVEHFDLTHDQKTDLLLAVWRIMQSFVDRAFGDDPVQQVRKGASAPQAVSGQSHDQDLSGAFARHATDKDGR